MPSLLSRSDGPFYGIFTHALRLHAPFSYARPFHTPSLLRTPFHLARHFYARCFIYARPLALTLRTVKDGTQHTCGMSHVPFSALASPRRVAASVTRRRGCRVDGLSAVAAAAAATTVVSGAWLDRE